MTKSEDCRRKSDEFLRQAAKVADLNERSRLISLAVHWHTLAVEAAGDAEASRQARATIVPFGPAAQESA